MKKLSVIVPVGHGRFSISLITQWVKLSQGKNFQIIFILDGLLEDESILFEELQFSFPAEEIIVKKGIFGSPGSARNEGLKLATSEWLAFWDADDWPEVDEIARLIRDADFDAEILVGSFETRDFSSKEIIKKIVLPQDLASAFKQIALRPGIWRFIFKRASLKGVYFPESSMGEDQCFLIQVNIPARKICLSTAIIYQYYIGNSSQVTKDKRLIKDLSQSISESLIFYRYQKRNILSLNEDLIARQILTLASKNSMFSNFFRMIKVLNVFSGLSPMRQLLIAKSLVNVFVQKISSYAWKPVRSTAAL
jgi:glycosyltransferase involved in cell wall biosynthesis